MTADLERSSSVLLPEWSPSGVPLRGAFAPARWELSYKRVVQGVDLLAVSAGVAVAAVAYAAYTTAEPALWFYGVVVAVSLAALALSRTRDRKMLGSGSEEFRRIGRAGLVSLSTLAVIAVASDENLARLQVLAAPVLATAFTAGGRVACRKALHRMRRAGRCTMPVLAAGDPAAITDLVHRSRRMQHAGWDVRGACIPGSAATVPGVDRLPVLGQIDAVAEMVRKHRFRIVAVLPSAAWTPERLKRLAWDLEGTGAELVVAPVLMEVAGPRLHVSPVLGMPLLHVSEPVFKGATRVGKEAFDRGAALLALTVLSPLLLAVALAVRTTSPGPVLFRQQRIGRDGSTFVMVKFRSMVADAETRRVELVSDSAESGPLFKIRADPRVTRVGKVLRRYSLDELPQLLNVIAGSMSLVGPRPPLPGEVAQYERDHHRRLLVKPGLTGLWQVSGRSDLSWEESINLDLRYVENWSMALDATILWKTVSAVRRGSGAY